MGKAGIFKRIKYPKFILFFITLVLAYYLFANKDIPFVRDNLLVLGYFGIFVIGMLFTYGFTAAFSVALLLIVAPDFNPIVAALIGGAGALLSDSLIFLFIRTAFRDEIIRLEHEKIIRYIKKKIPSKIRRIILPVLGGLIIASPLPDELGVSMLAAYRNISPKMFAFISYIMNSLGILVILLIGRAI